MLIAKLATATLKKLFREAYVATHTTNNIVGFCHGLREIEIAGEGDSEPDDQNKQERGTEAGVFIKGKLVVRCKCTARGLSRSLGFFIVTYILHTYYV
jgi:hypothetical protein